MDPRRLSAGMTEGEKDGDDDEEEMGDLKVIREFAVHLNCLI